MPYFISTLSGHQYTAACSSPTMVILYFIYLLLDAHIYPHDLLSSCMESNEGLSLIVTIDGIEEDKGNIEICLVSDKTLFLKACDFHESILVSGQSSLQYRFENIPAGMYAVSLFHDLNQNQLLDKRSFLSIPKEPFGFSNNPHLVFGPPKFDDCLFDLQEADQEVKIKLRRF